MATTVVNLKGHRDDLGFADVVYVVLGQDAEQPWPGIEPRGVEPAARAERSEKRRSYHVLRVGVAQPPSVMKPRNWSEAEQSWPCAARHAFWSSNLSKDLGSHEH